MTDRIELFYNKGSSKSQNDAQNKIREDVIVFLENELSPEYAAVERWQHLYTNFHETISLLCPVPEYQHVKIIKKAGRMYNYDFDVVYFAGTETHTIKLEFKHNSSKLEKIPQILSLQDRFGLIRGLSYTEYYYANYLDKYLDAIMYKGPKPTLSEYMSLVTGTSPDKHEMFMSMRAGEGGTLTAAIVNESIHTYLTTYITHFDTEKLSQKLAESQANKYFLMWDLSQFHVDTLTAVDLDIKHIELKKTKNINTIIAISLTTEYHLLLRWRNHNGILNPAWQIKIAHKSG